MFRKSTASNSNTILPILLFGAYLGTIGSMLLPAPVSSSTVADQKPDKLFKNCRPILLSLLPVSGILLYREQYIFTSPITGLSDLGIGSFLLPAIVSTLLLFTNTGVGLYTARFLAITQLGGAKVFLTELNQRSDILFRLSDIATLTRVGNPTELTHTVTSLLESYHIIPNPLIVQTLVQQSGVSITKARDLTTDYIINLLNPSVGSKIAAFLYTNAFGVVTTVLISIASAA